MTREEQISEKILSIINNTKKPMSITDLAIATKFNRHTLSRHLDRLFIMGKLDMRQHGQKKKYFLPDNIIEFSLLNFSPHILIILHTDYSIEWANETFLRNTGMSLKEVMGVKINSLTNIFFSNVEMELQLNSLQKGGSSFFEISAEIGGEIRTFMITLAYISVIELKPAIVVAGEDITKRRKMEEIIKESEQNFRIIAQNVNDIIIRQTIDGIITYISPACIHLTGYYPEELIDHPISSHIHPSDMPKIKLLKTSSETDFFPTHSSFRFMKQDGQYRWFEGIDNPRLSESGEEVLEYISVWRDISERIDAEEHIRESEEKFREVFNNASDSMVIFNLDEKGRPGRIIEVNNALCTILDLPKEELVNKMFFSLFSPKDMTLLPQILENISQGKNSLLELNLVKNNAQYLPMEIIFHRFFIKGEKVGLIIGRDIKARKSIEETLKESHEQINNILEFFVHPTFVIDNYKNVTFWNRGMEELTHTSKKEILGKGDREYSYVIYREKKPILVDYILDRNPTILSDYQNVIFRENSVSADITIKNSQTGRYSWFSAKASPLYNIKGVVIGAIETIQDITEQKVIENAVSREIRILETINQGYFHFIQNIEPAISIESFLQKICMAAEVSRVSIVKKLIDTQNQTIIQYHNGWTEEGVPSLKKRRELLKYIQEEHEDSLFRTVLNDGQSVYGSITDFSSDDRCILEKNGILSLVVIPFLTESEVCGFISFDDCRSARKWTEGEYQALLAAKNLIFTIFLKFQK